MSELPDESVQCVITSPPYLGLRKYSGEQELVWGDNQCEHQWIVSSKYWDNRAASLMAVGEGADFGGKKDVRGKLTTNTCSLCGAWKGAFGLEPTPEMYIEHTIEILREIRRVLRKDGVVFWNIGDSYASGKGTCFNPGGGSESLEGHANLKEQGAYPLDRGNKSTLEASHLKPKDLCLIPFRVAIAAQSDGWWVRSVIIWSKPNPMPESVTDRPTESHEYILMLTKAARYYWDADAVRELHKAISLDRWGNGGEDTYSTKYNKENPDTKVGNLRNASNPLHHAGRNIRTVWEFPTQPYPEAHFAVFPEKLPETCIKAATPEMGCCSKCGRPRVRITERQSYGKEGWAPAKKDHTKELQGSQSFSREEGLGACGFVDVKTLGWQPACNCNADTVPSIVLDPFMGTGTVLWVAKKLNRRAVGYDLSAEYCEQAVERNRQQAMTV